MPLTYEPIATTTLSGSSSTIVFNSVPSGYTDLRLIVFAFDSSQYANLRMQFNSDTSTNYSTTVTYANGGGGVGSSIYTNRSYVDLFNWTTGSSSVPSAAMIDIFSYTNNKFKSVYLQGLGILTSTGYVSTSVATWRSTATITAIQLALSSGSFQANTQATLYGIQAA